MNGWNGHGEGDPTTREYWDRLLGPGPDLDDPHDLTAPSGGDDTWRCSCRQTWDGRHAERHAREHRDVYRDLAGLEEGR